MPPLNPEQGKKVKNEIWAVLDNNEPPLTENERNGMNAAIGEVVDTYVTEGSGGSQSAPLKVVEMPWPSATVLPRSATQTHACQFKFTVAQAEVPRPGRLLAAPAGPAGTEKFTHKWSQSPHADAEGGSPGSEAHFQVGKAGYGQTIMPGETWYVAVKMTGGNTGEKFVGELAANAPN